MISQCCYQKRAIKKHVDSCPGAKDKHKQEETCHVFQGSGPRFNSQLLGCPRQVWHIRFQHETSGRGWCHIYNQISELPHFVLLVFEHLTVHFPCPLWPTDVEHHLPWTAQLVNVHAIWICNVSYSFFLAAFFDCVSGKTEVSRIKKSVAVLSSRRDISFFHKLQTPVENKLQQKERNGHI
jgi:hypothetical protein